MKKAHLFAPLDWVKENFTLLTNRVKANEDSIAKVNSDLGTDFTTAEVKTNDTLLGRPIYTKTLRFTTSISGGTDYTRAHDISNIREIWLDMANSFFISGTSKYSVPISSPSYGQKTEENWTAHVNNSVIIVSSRGGWSEGWEKFITLRYTKTTD